MEARKNDFMHLEAKKGLAGVKVFKCSCLKELKEEEKGEVDMCTAIEQMMEEREELGIERGLQRGKEQGEIRVNQLIEILLRQSGKNDDYEEIRRAVTDREYQKKLFDEFGI